MEFAYSRKLLQRKNYKEVQVDDLEDRIENIWKELIKMLY